MYTRTKPETIESVLGAIARAKQLPDVACAESAGGEDSWGDWEHDGVWLGDWGKSDSLDD